MPSSFNFLNAKFCICFIYLANFKPFGVVYKSWHRGRRVSFGFFFIFLLPEGTIGQLQLGAKSVLWTNIGGHPMQTYF